MNKGVEYEFKKVRTWWVFRRCHWCGSKVYRYWRIRRSIQKRLTDAHYLCMDCAPNPACVRNYIANDLDMGREVRGENYPAPFKRVQ